MTNNLRITRILNGYIIHDGSKRTVAVNSNDIVGYFRTPLDEALCKLKNEKSISIHMEIDFLDTTAIDATHDAEIIFQDRVEAEILKEMWHIEEKLFNKVNIEPSEKTFYNVHLPIIKEYYQRRASYWRSK